MPSDAASIARAAGAVHAGSSLDERPAASNQRRRRALCLTALLGILWAAAALAVDPLNTMRAFCQADGRGERIDPRTWPNLAGLVTWGLEPAWDHLYLISGFELGSPQARDGGFDVDVQYTLTAEVRSRGVTAQPRVESRTYHLVRGDDGAWRIRAPAPPPYIFASEADDAALAALLDPEKSTYLSNSAFAWRLLRGAGWEVAYADTVALATDSELTNERTAQVGDMVLYFDGDSPYHVGIVESDDSIVSATLNGGIRRTEFGAFAGEIQYRRPIASAAATPTVTSRPGPPAKKRGGSKRRKTTDEHR